MQLKLSHSILIAFTPEMRIIYNFSCRCVTFVLQISILSVETDVLRLQQFARVFSFSYVLFSTSSSITVFTAFFLPMLRSVFHILRITKQELVENIELMFVKSLNKLPKNVLMPCQI